MSTRQVKLMCETVLLISDRPSQLQTTEYTLQHYLHYRTIAANRVQAAMDWLRSAKEPSPDIILLDLESVSGMGGIGQLKALRPNLPIIVMTDYGDKEHAVDAIKAGAIDFLSKPVPVERLMISIQNALRMQCMHLHIHRFERQLSSVAEFKDMVGNSPAFRHALMQARLAAASKMPVWIEGESGTGKELLARVMHGSSIRAGKPFVTVNCSMLAMRPAMYDEERWLFNKINQAQHGTLLFKEIEALDEATKSRILEVLASGMIRSANAESAVPVAVRFVFTASNKKYSGQMNDFRHKVSNLFKISVISLPSLRSRHKDILLLAQHFCALQAALNNKRIHGITNRAQEWLEQQPWHGNVPELSNAILRAVETCDADMLDITHFGSGRTPKILGILGASLESACTGLIDEAGQPKTLKCVEREAIRLALHQSKGSMTRAARSLGIGRSTLYRKVSEFGLEGEESRGQANGYISRANQTTLPITKVSSMERS